MPGVDMFVHVGDALPAFVVKNTCPGWPRVFSSKPESDTINVSGPVNCRSVDSDRE
jgi:hypothetical protein